MQYILKMAITSHKLLSLQLISSHFITSMCNGFKLAWNVCSSLSLWSFISLKQEHRDHARILAEIIQCDNLASRKFHYIILSTNVVCFSGSEEVKLLSVEKRAYVVTYCMIAYLVFRINTQRKSDPSFLHMWFTNKGCQRRWHFLIRLVDFTVCCDKDEDLTTPNLIRQWRNSIYIYIYIYIYIFHSTSRCLRY